MRVSIQILSMVAATLFMASCKAPSIAPGPRNKPITVTPEITRVEKEIDETSRRATSVVDAATRVAARHPTDQAIQKLKAEAIAAKEQTDLTRAAFDDLKMKARAMEEDLKRSYEELEQYKTLYAKEYEKRVKFEQKNASKRKWLTFSGLGNILTIVGAVLMFKFKIF